MIGYIVMCEADCEGIQYDDSALPLFLDEQAATRAAAEVGGKYGLYGVVVRVDLSTLPWRAREALHDPNIAAWRERMTALAQEPPDAPPSEERDEAEARLRARHGNGSVERWEGEGGA